MIFAEFMFLSALLFKRMGVPNWNIGFNIPKVNSPNVTSGKKSEVVRPESKQGFDRYFKT